MAEVFVIKGIKPQRLKVAAIRLELLNALRKEGTIHRKELAKTVATWTGDKPKFSSAISLSGGEAAVLTGPEGSKKGVDKWGWLNDGTRIRWALMSSNWRSKTKPGRFRSGGGRGRAVLIGRRAFARRNMKPRPGIKPRGWTPKLTKQRRRPFTRSMIRAMQKGAQKAY